ncbi:MAG: hypothetical protein JWQ12_1669 [Glaciihabitans sp.]|nr:hypothetical protein [Glaciihabitans sp.]
MSSAQDAVVVAVDIGSSGVRAFAFAADLTVAATAERAFVTLVDDSGRSAHDWDEVLANTIACIADVAASSFVAAIVLSGTASCVAASVGSGATRQIVGDVLLWSDARSAAHAAQTRQAQVDGYPRTLCPAHLSYWPAKLLWLRATSSTPLSFAGAKDYVFEHLTGRFWTDPMSAAATGIFDSALWRWDEELLAAAGICESQLPAVRDATEVATLRGELAAALGMAADTPVVLGGMDGPLAQLGAGGFGTDSASCTVGTSIAYRTGVDARVVDAGARVWCYPVFRDFWVLGGAGSNGGNVLSYTAGIVGNGVGAAVSDAFDRPSDPALVFLPYVWGERAPLWRDELRGAIVGLGPHHTAADLNRAALDGIAILLLELAAAVMSLGGIPSRVYLTGGFLRNDAWAQLMTDALGRETCVPEPEYATANGAAILGWLALGTDRADVASRPAVDRRMPSPAIHSQLQERAVRARRVRDALYPVGGLR